MGETVERSETDEGAINQKFPGVAPSSGPSGHFPPKGKAVFCTAPSYCASVGAGVLTGPRTGLRNISRRKIHLPLVNGGKYGIIPNIVNMFPTKTKKKGEFL